MPFCTHEHILGLDKGGHHDDRGSMQHMGDLFYCMLARWAMGFWKAVSMAGGMGPGELHSNVLIKAEKG